MYYCPICQNSFIDERVEKLEKCPIYSCNENIHNMFKLDDKIFPLIKLLDKLNETETEYDGLYPIANISTNSYSNFISISFFGFYEFKNTLDSLLSNGFEIFHDGENDDEYTTELCTSLDDLKEKVENILSMIKKKNIK